MRILKEVKGECSDISMIVFYDCPKCGDVSSMYVDGYQGKKGTVCRKCQEEFVVSYDADGISEETCPKCNQVGYHKLSCESNRTG